MLAKLEASYGTDAAPVATANAIATVRGQFTFGPEYDAIRREIMDGGIGFVAGENVLPRISFKLRVELRGNRSNGATPDISAGSSANAIEIDPLLQACDLNPTYTAETVGGARDGNVTYRPKVPADEGKSCTFYFYSEKKLHKVLGAKGTLKGVFEAGKFAYLDFEFMGLYAAPTDSSIPGAITWGDTKPPLFVNSGSTFDAYSAVFSKLDFDLGAKVIRRDDANSTDGVKGFIIGERDTKASFNPESVAEATHPFWADLKNGKVKTLLAKLGSQSGNRFDLTMTCQHRSLTYEDNGGNRVHNCQLDVVRSALSTQLGNEFLLKAY